MSTLARRQAISLDTIARTPDITAAHAHSGATLESQFIPSQLPPLDPHPNANGFPISVINSDSFTAARAIIKRNPEARGKVAVLNLASDQHPGGGWDQTLCKTQEEALCYSSTLFGTLKPTYYPWPNRGDRSVAGVYSPGVVVFKDDLDHECVDLPETERETVAVITVAAPRAPRLTPDNKEFANSSTLEDLRGKIRLVYRMAASHGNEYLVAGAMGCGAYRCPPRLVAEEMKAILLEDEFKGYFREVVFAVYSHPDDPVSNYEIFKSVFG